MASMNTFRGRSATSVKQGQLGQEIERYLLTGQTDAIYSSWSGTFMERATQAHYDLRGALVEAVRRLSDGRSHHPLPEVDLVTLTRAKVEPMVRGFFPRSEQDILLETLQKSVVFVTQANQRIRFAPGFDGESQSLESTLQPTLPFNPPLP